MRDFLVEKFVLECESCRSGLSFAVNVGKSKGHADNAVIWLAIKKCKTAVRADCYGGGICVVLNRSRHQRQRGMSSSSSYRTHYNSRER